MGYDLLIRGGRLIDAGQGVDERMDIGISGGNIVDVAPGLNASDAAEVIAADGLVVVPGLIDFHAHAMMLNGIGLGTDLDRVLSLIHI